MTFMTRHGSLKRRSFMDNPNFRLVRGDIRDKEMLDHSFQHRATYAI